MILNDIDIGNWGMGLGVRSEMYRKENVANL